MGHGNLAMVADGQLLVLDSAGTLSTVTGPPSAGFDSTPAWSRDGRWLAFLHQLAPRADGSAPPPTLWLVAAGSSTATEVTDAGIGTYQWSPTAERLAYTTLDPPGVAASAGNLWTDVPGAPPVPVPGLHAGATVGSLSWSPTGTTFAIDELLSSPSAGSGVLRTDMLVLLPAGGGRGTVIYEHQGSGIDVAGWWPNAKGVLFWVDAGFSASLAADGLPLDSLALGSTTPVTLASTLVGSQWLAPAPATTAGDDVAMVAGGGRYVWMKDRHVEVCSLATGTCTALPAPTAEMTLAPAWTSSGALVVTDASASAPYGSAGGSFAPAAMAAWDATASVSLFRPSGTSELAVAAPSWESTPDTAAGAGTVLAQPAAHGTALLEVHDDSLWLQSSPTAPSVRIAGPLAQPADPGGYYGELDWQTTFAWSEAAGPRGGRVAPSIGPQVP